MSLVFREARAEDIPAMFSVRARTRENALTEDSLASVGITRASVGEAMATGRMKGWVCLQDSECVGFCNGDAKTGEVLVLAVLPELEGKGIGSQLLSHVTAWLRSAGCKRLWLAATSSPEARAHGFYRSLGWQPTGEIFENGEEILVLKADN